MADVDVLVVDPGARLLWPSSDSSSLLLPEPARRLEASVPVSVASPAMPLASRPEGYLAPTVGSPSCRGARAVLRRVVGEGHGGREPSRPDPNGAGCGTGWSGRRPRWWRRARRLRHRPRPRPAAGASWSAAGAPCAAWRLRRRRFGCRFVFHGNSSASTNVFRLCGFMGHGVLLATRCDVLWASFLCPVCALPPYLPACAGRDRPFSSS